MTATIKELLKYKGNIHYARMIVHDEGLFGLWAGAAPIVMRNGTNQVVMFTTKNTFDELLWKKNEGDRNFWQPWESMTSGFLAGLAGRICTGPLDVVKTRLMAQSSVVNYKRVLRNHRLVLKVGVPIMLLRNIDQSNGLCNGTRPEVLRLSRTSIQAYIINGTHFENKVIIPRLRISPSDKRLPLKIVRKQYPISVSFALTINKSQGQSLSRVGLYVPHPVFTHGQLYVALSRVKSKKGLKVVVSYADVNLSKTTTNVVYKEVLQGL